MVPGAADVASRPQRREETLVATSADIRPLPSGPLGERAERIAIHRGLSGHPRRDAETEAPHPQQLPPGVPGHRMNLFRNSATSKLALRAGKVFAAHHGSD